jgi:hypothetical protein
MLTYLFNTCKENNDIITLYNALIESCVFVLIIADWYALLDP